MFAVTREMNIGSTALPCKSTNTNTNTKYNYVTNTKTNIKDTAVTRQSEITLGSMYCLVFPHQTLPQDNEQQLLLFISIALLIVSALNLLQSNQLRRNSGIKSAQHSNQIFWVILGSAAASRPWQLYRSIPYHCGVVGEWQLCRLKKFRRLSNS